MKALLDDLLEFNRAKLGVGITMRPADVDVAIVLSEELNLLRAAYPGRRIDVQFSGDAHGVWDGMKRMEARSTRNHETRAPSSP